MRQSILCVGLALMLSACAPGDTLEESSTTTTAAQGDAVQVRVPEVGTFLEHNPALARRVERKIAEDPKLSMAAANVNVTTYGNTVTLSGSVADYATLDSLKAVLDDMTSVTHAYYDVVVWPLHDPDQRASDENIAFSLQRSLVDEPRVTIDVVRGNVTLRGEALSSSREEVEGIVTTTPGVAAVTNELEVDLDDPMAPSALVQ